MGGHKLGKKYFVPYKVITCINPVTVEFKLPKALRHIHPVFHTSFLKRDPSAGARRPEKVVPPAIIIDGKEHHKMAKILGYKFKLNVLFYF